MVVPRHNLATVLSPLVDGTRDLPAAPKFPVVVPTGHLATAVAGIDGDGDYGVDMTSLPDAEGKT